MQFTDRSDRLTHQHFGFALWRRRRRRFEVGANVARLLQIAAIDNEHLSLRRQHVTWELSARLVTINNELITGSQQSYIRVSFGRFPKKRSQRTHIVWIMNVTLFLSSYQHIVINPVSVPRFRSCWILYHRLVSKAPKRVIHVQLSNCPCMQNCDSQLLHCTLANNDPGNFESKYAAYQHKTTGSTSRTQSGCRHVISSFRYFEW